MQKISDVALRKLAGVPGKSQLVTIGGGLSLRVTLNKGMTRKVWFLRYRNGEGKQQNVVLGQYPEMSMAQAMLEAEKASAVGKREKVSLAQSRNKADPTPETRLTFRDLAEKWLDVKALTWVPAHLKRQRERLQGHLFLALGNKGIDEITMIDVDAALLPLVKAGKNETAKRATDLVRNVFQYADNLGLTTNGAMIERLRKYRTDNIPVPAGHRHLYKAMPEEWIGKLLADVWKGAAHRTFQVAMALKLHPYIFLRPSELCGGQWREIDLAKAEWLIPAERMKSRKEHVVPLPHQAVSILEELRGLTGGQEYLFPTWGHGGKPISTNALISAFRSMGYGSTRGKDGRRDVNAFVPHAWRGVASSTLHQNSHFNEYKSGWIEHQLAHSEKDKVKDAYNALTAYSYIDERRRMMQAYADYLDGLRLRAEAGRM